VLHELSGRERHLLVAVALAAEVLDADAVELL
jgi:hypothetical protein